MHQEEECLEAEEIRKEIEVEFSLDVRNEHFDESEEIEKQLKHDDREEESEYETEELSCRTFDG